MSAGYRVGQFIRAAGAWARPQEVDEALLGRHLPPDALALFQAMPRYDQKHALNVFGTLQRHSYDEPDLLAAALLHDVGKSPPQGGRLLLWHRVAVVLMRAFWPSLLERLGRAEPGGWRQPFHTHQHHAAIGAELARRAGCSPGVVALIRHHEDQPAQAGDPLQAALQSADSMN